jgi:hypothetical protein
MTTPFLAHNLAVRRTKIEEVQLVTSVGWIGNAAHQAECSDHNPDSTGCVHAIDAMTLVLANQKIIVNWCLAHFGDLQYVINQRTIWKRDANGVVRPYAYTGNDPHTNHVHISGRHGIAGKDAATCTGYSRTAEQTTPEGIPMPLTDADKAWITAQIPTAAEVAEAVLAYPLANEVVVGVNSKTGDFIRDIHKRAYSIWLAENQPEPTWPTPAKS